MWNQLTGKLVSAFCYFGTFSRLFCQQLKERIKAATLETIQVKIWETGIAWAAYREEV